MLGCLSSMKNKFALLFVKETIDYQTQFYPQISIYSNKAHFFNLQLKLFI